jgi:hypothetical protein
MIEFHEDGMVCEVEVLEDTSDVDWDRYKLRVKRILAQSSIFKSPEIGEEFSVEQSRHGAWGGMWHLTGYRKI